jgi:hypothetical protein
MTEDDFRSAALSLADAVEASHMNHPDFRVKGKIFASLGYPEAGWAMVKLTPAQQRDFVRAHPDAFVTVKGGWGRQGATNVHLRAANKPVVKEALALAWRNIATRKSARQRTND